MKVFTDGACLGNPGPGGWAYAEEGNASRSGGEPRTTNQRMELTAVLRALEDLEGPIEIYSDSTYVVNCFNQKWYVGWMRKGWRNSKGDPVANRDLWEPLLDLYLKSPTNYSFHWVKGHSGVAGNELVDELARSEAQKAAEN